MDTPQSPAQTIAMCALGISAANFLLNWIIYINNRGKVNNERIKELETNFGKKVQDVNTELGDSIKALEMDIDAKFVKQGESIARLEEGAEHGPTQHDLGLLHEKINTVSNDVSHVKGQLDAVDSNLKLIMNQIMKRGMP